MESTDKELLAAIDQSARDLRTGMDLHRRLVAQAMGREEGGKTIECPVGRCPSPNRETRLRKAIEEAIEVLEESRKAFKSKTLEVLRKKLTRVLIDSG